MKKIYFFLMLLFFAIISRAQYSEVWNADVTNNYVIGCENMDNDANKEIISIHYNGSNNTYNGINIIDGITGKIEWGLTGGDFDKDDCKLVDVNNDSKYELLFFGSDGKTYGLHLYSFGGTTKSVEISANSNLKIENYPNPFNTVTTIKYNVPVKSLVVVKVFDMNGNEIKILANAQQSQGDYEIPFNRDDLQNGTYFYQVKVGSQVGAKKMVVIE